MTQPTTHIVLLGDSILDNGAYTRGEPDVVSHLRTLLPTSARATNLAVDGATVAGLRPQLARVPPDATHLIVSVGGNDALQNSDLLTLRVSSSAEVFREFSARLARFEPAYRAAIASAVALKRRTTICTIYNGALEPERAEIARLALSIFNDVIVRTGLSLGIDVLELRAICVEPSDYANPIEPSGRGGLKIAGAIARLASAPERTGDAVRLWGAA